MNGNGERQVFSNGDWKTWGQSLVSMKFWTGVTDNDWFKFLAARKPDEVNFWQPSAGREFRALSPGSPFLFKLHHPHHFIVGGGFFTHYSQCSIRLAWDAFGEKNGVSSLDELRQKISEHRSEVLSERLDDSTMIGCILLRDPFFFPRPDWIPAPPDFAKNIVQGKTYDIDTSLGRQVWDAVMDRLGVGTRKEMAADRPPMWGDPVLVKQRLGQGTFRLLVTDAYERRCAVTREKALPVLEAAHIRPVTEGGTHRIDNGLLLRSDIHTLFDRGYVTLSLDYHFRVSRHLKQDFDNGEHYYQLEGSTLWLPSHAEDRPGKEFLEWHGDTKFRG